jgi:hypothetical protein
MSFRNPTSREQKHPLSISSSQQVLFHLSLDLSIARLTILYRIQNFVQTHIVTIEYTAWIRFNVVLLCQGD